MQRLMLVLFVVLSGFAPCAIGQEAPIDGPDLVIPQQRVIAPSPVPDGGVTTISKVEATATIRNQVATTHVTVTLSNPSRRPREAQVLLPVPTGATVRGFVMEGFSEKGVARILSREEARRIYRQIVSQTRDPGLLEFAGHNLMRSSVFPVPAGGSQAVTLMYEQVLASDLDRVDYVLPRSEALETTDIPWSISVEIESDRAISTVYSPSHEIVTERGGAGKARVTVPASSAKLPGAFRLSYLLESSEGVSATLLAYPDPELGDGGYFLLLAGLPTAPPEGAKAVQREVILVLDRSGSMRGEKIEQAVEAARQVIEGLEEGEAFNIIDYSDSVELFADAPVVKNEASIERARKYLGEIRASGGTNIHDALVEAVRQPVTEGRLPMVLFLTDGLPTVGQRSEVAIREAVKSANREERRIFSFGVGYDVNAPLLSAIAKASRGATTYVAPEEDVEVKVGQVFRRLSGPVLAAPELATIDGGGAVRIREVMPRELSDLFEGDQLVVLGQYRGDRPKDLRLELTGEYFGDERSFEFSFDLTRATTRNAFVPRLWATRKIGALIDEIRQAKANGHVPEDAAMSDERLQELVDEIVRLSIRWGVLTEYTAFLATPEDVMEANLGLRFERRGASPAAGGRGGVTPGEPARDRAAQAEGVRLNVLRSSEERWGMGAAERDKRLDAYQSVWNVQQQMAVLGQSLDGKATDVAMRTVSDLTFFNDRRGRWIEAALFTLDADTEEEAKEQDEPERTVEFGTDEYMELASRLVREGRAAVLTLPGEIYLSIDEERVLVRGPEALEQKD